MRFYLVFDRLLNDDCCLTAVVFPSFELCRLFLDGLKLLNVAECLIFAEYRERSDTFLTCSALSSGP